MKRMRKGKEACAMKLSRYPRRIFLCGFIIAWNEENFKPPLPAIHATAFLLACLRQSSQIHLGHVVPFVTKPLGYL